MKSADWAEARQSALSSTQSWMQPRLRPLGNTFVNFPTTADLEDADNPDAEDAGEGAPAAPMEPAVVRSGNFLLNAKRGRSYPGYVPYELQEDEDKPEGGEGESHDMEDSEEASRMSSSQAPVFIDDCGPSQPAPATLSMPGPNMDPTGDSYIARLPDPTATLSMGMPPDMSPPPEPWIHQMPRGGVGVGGCDPSGPPPPAHAPPPPYGGGGGRMPLPGAGCGMPPQLAGPASLQRGGLGHAPPPPMGTAPNHMALSAVGGVAPCMGGDDMGLGSEMAASGSQAVPSLLRNGVTTLMIRNLPLDMLQNDLLRELERCGLLDSCDFVYMPSSFGTRRGKGYAFVNFTNPDAAEIFFNTWHKSRRFGMAANIALNVSAAVVQGRDANVARWDSAKMRRVKNSNYRPYIPGLNAASTPTGGRMGGGGMGPDGPEAPQLGGPFSAEAAAAAAMAAQCGQGRDQRHGGPSPMRVQPIQRPGQNDRGQKQQGMRLGQPGGPPQYGTSPAGGGGPGNLGRLPGSPTQHGPLATSPTGYGGMPDFGGRGVGQGMPDFGRDVGQGMHDFRAPDIGGQGMHDFRAPDIGGQGMHDFRGPPDIGGQGMHDFRGPPDIGGQGMRDFRAPDVGGQGMHDFRAPDVGGQGMHDFRAPDVGGQGGGFRAQDVGGQGGMAVFGDADLGGQGGYSPPAAGFPDVAPGHWVQILGLMHAPEFNGKWGMVESYDPVGQRFMVRVALSAGEPSATGQWVRTKVHRDNLMPRRYPMSGEQALSTPNYTL